MIPLAPTSLDVWFISAILRLLGRWPLLDLSIQSAIRHDVLGGICFAATLFIYWSRSQTAADNKHRTRAVTTLIGSAIAIIMATAVAVLFKRVPPNQTPTLFHYPDYLLFNPNSTCFPSMSATLYASVAAGIASINRRVGTWLWIAVVVLVALPRIYVGGHYPTDVVAGVFLGWLGYLCARWAEAHFAGDVQQWFGMNRLRATLGTLLVFVSIFQIAVEFREANWLRHSVKVLARIAFNSKGQSVKEIFWQ